MESPLEVLSRVAFMVNKTLPQPADYAGSLQKYGTDLTRLSCWRAKDFGALKRLEQRQQKKSRSAPIDEHYSGQDRPPSAETDEDAKARRHDNGKRSGVQGLQLCRSPSAEGDSNANQWAHPSILGRDVEVLLGSQPVCNKRSTGTSPVPAAHDTGGSREERQTIDADSEPLNLSIRRRSSTPERKPSPGASVVTSATDPAVEEHFRRSLGKCYEGAHASRGQDGGCSHITAAIEEHFFKSLGGTYLKPDSPAAPSTVSATKPDAEPVRFSETQAAAAATRVQAQRLLPLSSRQLLACGGGSGSVHGGSPPAAIRRKRSRQPTRDAGDDRGQSRASHEAFAVGERHGTVSDTEPASLGGLDPADDTSAKKSRRCDEPLCQQLQQQTHQATAAPEALGITIVTAGGTRPAASSASAALATSVAAVHCGVVRSTTPLHPRPATPPAEAAPAATGSVKDVSDDVQSSRREPAADVSNTPAGRLIDGSGAASVDEHFAKALGYKWAEIKRHLTAPPPAGKEEL